MGNIINLERYDALSDASQRVVDRLLDEYFNNSSGMSKAVVEQCIPFQTLLHYEILVDLNTLIRKGKLENLLAD